MTGRILFFCGLALGARSLLGADVDWAKLSAAEFWSRPEVLERIVPQSLDRTRLAVAIFHETNRQRVEAGLPALGVSHLLDEAARMQSSLGAMRMYEHSNPFPGSGTSEERIHHTGLKTRFTAENILLLALLDMGASETLHLQRDEGGHTHYVDPNSGEDLLPHTYVSFARAAVKLWMNSPGHRANILNPKLQLLGVSIQPGKDYNGIDDIFVVEDFCTPAK